MSLQYKGKLNAIVIASGITYGNKEDILHMLFKQAWYNELELPIIQPGNNKIPLIYIGDLASVVAAVMEQPPKKPKYILAIEQTMCTQKKIVKAIAKSLGSNKTKIVSKTDAFLWEDMTQIYYDNMTVNLNMEPNYIVNDLGVTFHSDLNFAENIAKMVQEYKNSRKLFPVKVFLHGPPAVGKTSIAKVLCEKYALHYLSVNTIIQDAIAKLEADLEYLREKQKAKEEKVEEEEGEEEEEEDEDEEDPEEIIGEMTRRLKGIRSAIEDSPNGRLPDETIIELVREKLASNPCQNQGYVLDGYPKTQEQARLLFGLEDMEKDEEEAEAEEEDEGGAKTNILPEFVIGLEADDEFLCMRVMRMSEKQIQGTHYTEDRMVSRLSEFRRNNTEDNTLLNLFDIAEIHPLMIDATTDIQERIINLITDKLGPKRGYPPLKEIEAARIAEELRKKEEERILEEKRQEIEAALIEEKKKTMEEWMDMTHVLQEQEEEMTVAQNTPLREYLMKFVFPTLTKGLVEVARVKPDDPIDFLAEYLFRENPEGHMFDPTYVKEGETLINTIREYQHQVSKFLNIEL